MAKKTWDLTINNYTDDEIAKLKLWENDVTRMVAAKEVGEKKGTAHLQIRVTFKRNYRWAAIKKLMPRAHCEETICEQDSLYCMKLDSEVVINIDNRKQGKRSDLHDCIDDAKNGMSMRELWEKHTSTMVRYEKGIKRAREVLMAETVERNFNLEDFDWEPITDWTKTNILLGPAGCGKTEFAKAHFDNPLFVTHIDDLLDFDGHDGIIFDDMSFTHMPRTAQIHILDQDNPRSIHCRYSCAPIPARTKKIITCNELCVNMSDEAIARRVNLIEVGPTCDRDRSEVR